MLRVDPGLSIRFLPGAVIANPMPGIDLCNILMSLYIRALGVPFFVKLDENEGIFVPRFRKKTPQAISGSGPLLGNRLARNRPL